MLDQLLKFTEKVNDRRRASPAYDKRRGARRPWARLKHWGVVTLPSRQRLSVASEFTYAPGSGGVSRAERCREVNRRAFQQRVETWSR